MSVPAKYIVFDTSLCDVPILFPGHVDHSMVAMAVSRHFPGWTPISAGMVDFNIISVEGMLSKVGETHAQCYGRSLSLKLLARHEIDSKLITRTFCG